MFELEEKLAQLPTFQALTAVQAEFDAVKTPKNFNPDDFAALEAQKQRLLVRAGLDRAAAKIAFRIEVATSSQSLLTLTERLAVTAAYDPQVRKRHQDNNSRASEFLSVVNKRGSRRAIALSNRREAMLLGREGWGVPSPLENAISLTTHITKAHDFVEKYSGEKVAIRLAGERVITGIMPSLETAFALSEPTVEGSTIDYTIPSSFSGITKLTSYTEKGSQHILARGIKTDHPLLEIVDHKVVANPQLSLLRQDLGLLGVNIFRSFYHNDFDEAIIPESDGWARILPETDPEQLRLLRRRRHY